MDNNSQETNENLDRLHPDYPAQFVLVNEDNGTVIWFENYRTAVDAHAKHGGVILNTETCPRKVINESLAAARATMNSNGTRANQ